MSLSLLSVGVLATESRALITSAQSAVLMEAESGRVLYAHNDQEEALIASITKLLTALVAVESGASLGDVVEISAESVGVEGSSLYLEEGEEISLEALLYGLLLHSGNDAATAIAIHCAGSVEDFVLAMNEKAVALGMTHSHFANPHGLDQEGHYASAYDMALVAQACLENEAVAKMVGTQWITLEGRRFTNKNKLLWYYEGCEGMKTGYTQEAGRTLVSTATREGMTLICVTLDDPNDWVDHQLLFDHGFALFDMVPLATAGESLGKIPVRNHLMTFARLGLAETLRYPLQRGEEVQLEVDLVQEEVFAPLFQGETGAGLGIWTLGEEVIAREPLVYLEDYPNMIEKKFNIWESFLEFIS